MKKINQIGVATILLISMLTIMVGAVIAPALIPISEELHFKFDRGLLITLPSLGVVLFSTFVGKLLSKIGSYQLLLLGLIPYAIFGFMGAFITNSYLLVADRLLLGAAAVAVQIASTAIIAENFTGKQRMKLIAWQGMAIEGGGVLFLSLGGFLGELYWQLPFYIYLIGLLYAILSFFVIPRTKIQQKEEKISSHLHNHKKQVYVIFLGALFAMIVFFASFIYLPQFLPNTFQFSETKTGNIMAFISLVAVVVASQMPKIVNKIGYKTTLPIGFVCFALAYLFLAYNSIAMLTYVSAMVLGIGFGLTVPLLNHLMVEVSNTQTRGKNLGLYSIGIFGGQFVATGFGLLTNNITLIFTMAAVIAITMALVLYLLFKRYPL